MPQMIDMPASLRRATRLSVFPRQGVRRAFHAVAMTLLGVAATCAWAIAVATAAAAEEDGKAGREAPAFASLRSDKVNMRAGPGREYPIRWIYRREGLPVEVRRSIGNWRLIRDFAGTQGWVHTALLSRTRTALVLGDGDRGDWKVDPNRTAMVPTGGARLMYDAPEETATVRARLAPNLILALVECRIDWCRVRVDGSRGWVRKADIWGAGPDEVFR